MTKDQAEMMKKTMNMLSEFFEDAVIITKERVRGTKEFRIDYHFNGDFKSMRSMLDRAGKDSKEWEDRIRKGS